MTHYSPTTAALNLVMLWFVAFPAAQAPSAVSQSVSDAAAARVELPVPTGSDSIGTKIFDWVDCSRHEAASKNPREFRQLIVQVWYPSGERSGPVSPYVPMLSAYRHVWEAAELDAASYVVTHSLVNAKPKARGRFPVVLLSHGWEGTRTEYTTLAEDLASHGYAVFGVDHPYMGRIAMPNGEVTEATESQFQNVSEIVSYYARDLQFVMGQIEELNRGNPGEIFAGKFDMTRIAAIGHSSGFVAASGACKLDFRINACINIDAPGFGANDLAGLKQPLLWIRLEKAEAVPTAYLKSAISPVYELRVEGANHGSVEDWDYLEAASPTQRKATARVLWIIRRYVEAFLARHLNDESPSLLKPGSCMPGIEWKVYRRSRDQ